MHALDVALEDEMRREVLVANVALGRLLVDAAARVLTLSMLLLLDLLGLLLLLFLTR